MSDTPTRLDLYVSSCKWAERFFPNKPTAALRIAGTEILTYQPYAPLQQSDLYVAEFSYMFDDIRCLTPEQCDIIQTLDKDHKPSSVPFSLTKACQLICDVHSVLDSVDALLVHCYHGISRSPAVAMGLNDVFDLGYDTHRMTYEFDCYNTSIYKQMLRAGSYLREQHILTHTR